LLIEALLPACLSSANNIWVTGELTIYFGEVSLRRRRRRPGKNLRATSPTSLDAKTSRWRPSMHGYMSFVASVVVAATFRSRDVQITVTECEFCVAVSP
jgi:hypothetical protein